MTAAVSLLTSSTAAGTAAANYAPAAEAAQKQSDASRSSSAKGTEAERLLKELRDYIDKGPIVALREKILKSMNLTEEKLKAMTPDQQNAIEAEIARKIKEYLLEQQEAAKNPTSPQQAQAWWSTRRSHR